MLPLSRKRFLQTHLLSPLLLFAAVAFILEATSLDIYLADRIYGLSGGTWSLRDAWITSTLIHDGGRLLVAAIFILLLLMLAGSFLFRPFRHYRCGLWYLLASTLAAGITINVLKELTHIHCPWDLSRYGGEFPYIHNFAFHPGWPGDGGCFPAGHASAGYAWLGLYYFALVYHTRWRIPALLLVLLTGGVFGIGQQLRGAHFLSHDVWTLGLCWLIATLLYLLFFGAPDLKIYESPGNLHENVEDLARARQIF